MKAVLIPSPNEISISDVADPVRKESEVLIKVHGMGICGSDINAYKGTNPLVSYPRIIGHEISGEVLEVPAGESELKAGDRVVIEPYVFCGKCYPCLNQRTNCCENLQVRGVHIDGGMSEFCSHPRHLVHKVSDNVGWDLLAMIEPLTISVHAVRRSRAKKGEHVAVTGAGPIGLLAALFAKTLGAEPILIDPIEERLDFARKMGIRHTVNLKTENAVEKIKSITNGRMTEALVEASGSEAAIRSSLDYVAYSGRISLVGWPKGEVSLPTSLFTKKELDVVGSRNSFHAFPESASLISSNAINVRPLITCVIAFTEIPSTMKEMVAHPENFMKVVGVL
jgi:2-desacetyl-2-hydroxyethyl bacteriochlorophyllide A dehydrogenase